MSRNIVGIAALIAMFGSAADAELPAQLAKAAKEYDDAQMHGDGNVLDRLLADAYELKLFV